MTDNMTEQLKQAINALQCAKRGHCDHAMADEAIAALEHALTTSQPAQAGEVDERVEDSYGSTDIPWSFTVCRKLEPQEERLMSMLVKAFGSNHPAIDDMAHLILTRTTQPAAQATPEPDRDGAAFRTAARLGLTLRFYGGCAQSGMPGSPSAYEVVSAGGDPAAAMREAVERASAVIHAGGEAQKLATPEPVDWKPIKTSAGGREAVRSFFRSTLKRHDFDDYITGALAADFACVLGGYLQATTTPPQQAAGEPWGWVVNSTLFRGEFAEDDAKAEAKRCGGTSRAIKLFTHPAPGVPAKLPSAYATSTEDGTWRVLLAFDNKDDAEATRRFLHDHGVQPRTMRSTAPGVPEGFVLVPKVMTDKMREAARHVKRQRLVRAAAELKQGKRPDTISMALAVDEEWDAIVAARPLPNPPKGEV